MKIELEKIEIEMNRGWLTDEDGEAIGEINFVVPATWLIDLFDTHYSSKYENIDDFLDVYEPEVEGEFVYQKAIENGTLVEDLGAVYY